jgi:hypothetical protein
MIISEKQIMALIRIATDWMHTEDAPFLVREGIACLLVEIEAQQSEKLQDFDK